MRRICKFMVALLFRYGMIVGNQPSYHGTYEAIVPMSLKSASNKK